MNHHRIVPLNWIQWMTLGLMVAVALGFAYGFSRLEQTLNAVHQIQCDGKRNNATNLRASVLFLHEHPSGTSDFSKQFILNAIAEDKAKAKSFSNLDCTN